MEIEVKGHSGCSIEIVRHGKNLIIEKGTKDPKYVERLYQQALKQQKAQENKLQFIRIPEILNIIKNDNEMTMQMEYIYSKNFIDNFENAGFEQIDYFIKAIDLFIQNEIERSPLQIVPASIVHDKFADVKKKTFENSFIKDRDDVKKIIERSEPFFSNISEIILPVGICHGDLTLSNILFNGNNYFLIDFLDSFIESPLLDMVKIRQDTAHHWSPLMYDGEYDKTRFNIISRKIDKELDRLFSRYEWYVLYYDVFQLMNLLRVLQYGHEQKVVDYLVAEISSILDKMEKQPTSHIGYDIKSSERTETAKSFEKTIIIPIAADKPEYNEVMPHVFRMNDQGIMLCIAGILGLNLKEYDHIYFTILKKHSEHYKIKEIMTIQLQRLGLDKKAEIIELEEATNSQPHTIYTTIKKKNIKGLVFVKDADCYFDAEAISENGIYTFPLDSMSQVNPQGKSYIQTDDMFYITNIIERRIIGRDFCAGGYCFENADDFIRYYEQNMKYSPLYMSHIIYSALLDGQSFRPIKVKNYKDWGTRKDWSLSQNY